MKKENDSIENFQDLFLRGSAEHRTELREALQRYVKAPWRHAKDREQKISEDSGNCNVILFEREPTNGIAASLLVLSRTSDGYGVTNILPLKKHRLNASEYNDVLNDFVNQIAKPASKASEFQVEDGKRKQSITDWTSQEAANALHTFSMWANKSTGSSHPSDQHRWFQFLFAVHKAQGKVLDTHLLGRWLEEVENWPPEVATELVLEYEFALNLLNEYDRSFTDCTTQEATKALHKFSVSANKSTGSSHPSDQHRWFQFLFAVHKAHKAQGKVLDTHLLEKVA